MRNLLILAALLLTIPFAASFAAPVVPVEERTRQVPPPVDLQPPDGPPVGSECDPAYQGVVEHRDGKVMLYPAPVYQLPKTYIDIDVTQGGGELNITAPAFDVKPGEKFVAASEIVIRFVNPVDRSCKGACSAK